MTITFVSNFINHHQAPLCTKLYETPGVEFAFIQTEPMSKERILGGWALDEAMFSYVYFWYRDEALCRKKILESDILLLGFSRLPEDLVEERLSSGRITLRISERIYKEGRWKAVSPAGLLAKQKEHLRYKHKPVYMLCADAYAAGDFHLIGAYKGKLLRWGYFPETRSLTERVAKDSVDGVSQGAVRLCWAGRMIGWKHPEYAIRLAKTLADKKYNFTLRMIGGGDLREDLEAETRALKLQKQVIFCETLTPYEVRNVMEQSNVFLFTSSYLEGWGAVVNEAMNSACAVVASGEAGSVPYLITDGINGLTYKNGNYEMFERQVLRLMENEALRRQISHAAYDRIASLWNETEAARRLVAFCEALLDGTCEPFEDDGPLSPAPVLKSASFFRTRQEGLSQDHV